MSVLNRQEALERLGDDEDLFAEICELFCRDVPLMLSQLRVALADGDLVLAIRSAHSIKSASANVGADLLAAVARDAEEAGRVGNLEHMRGCLAQIEASFMRVFEELDQTP